MKRAMTRALGLLVCITALFFAAVSPFAYAMEIGTSVNVVVQGFEICSRTEDFTLPVGGSQRMTVTATRPVASCRWELSRDGGVTWAAPDGAADAAEYELRDARPNLDADGRDVAYQYRVTVTDARGESASAVIRVLVSNSYDYRKVSLREGDTDVSAYMHEETRLVVTPLGANTAAALTLTAELSTGTVPLLAYDVSLVNRSNQVVPYFGIIQVDFHVGPAYEGMELKAHHLKGDGGVSEYTGAVTGGVLSIFVDSLSPFVVEVPDASAHAVTVTASGGGSVSPSGTVNVPDGGSRSFTFLPDAGCVIGSVTLDGAPVAPSGSGNSFTLTDVRADHALAVSFEEAAPSGELRTLTVSSGANGAVSPSGSVRVSDGAAQTLYFYPDRGYELDTVTVSGTPVSVIGSSYTISAVDADADIAASFRSAATQLPDVYKTIAAASGANGSISPGGAVQILSGSSQSFSFEPAEGYELDTVTVDGAAVSVSGSAYQFSNVTADHTISVSFKQTPTQTTQQTTTPTTQTAQRSTIQRAVQRAAVTQYHTISASCGGNGEISPEGTVRVAAGNSTYFSIFPDEGYELDTLTVDGESAAAIGGVYCFKAVAAGHTIHATFRESARDVDKAVYHSISVSTEGSGSISPSGVVQVAHGGSQTFYLIAGEGCEVGEIYVNGKQQSSSPKQFALEDVTEDLELRVCFRPALPVDAGKADSLMPRHWLALLIILTAGVVTVLVLLIRRRSRRNKRVREHGR